MGLYYLDTSALVKLYIREPGTDHMLRLAARTNKHNFNVLTLARVEFRSAIRRRERKGDIEGSAAARLLSQFDQHLETKFVRQALSESLLDVASGLLDRYALRAYDAIQLAGCLTLSAASDADEPVFVCSDQRLIDAAKAEGLRSLDPSAA